MTTGRFIWYRTVRALGWLLVNLFFRLRVSGREHVPRDGRLLVAANHISPADPVLVGVAVPRCLDFLAAADLFGVPVWGALIRSFRCVPLNRSQLDPAAVREVIRRLRGEAAVVVFPEGRIRLDHGSILGSSPEIKEGAAGLAALAATPVLPVILQGTRHVLDWRQWLRRPTMTVTIGAPFCLWTPTGLSSSERRRQLREALTRELVATIPVRPRPQ